MIITCEECSTRFNLDDSLIKDDGSKVRCSECKHVFTVFPPPISLEPDAQPITDTADATESVSDETPDSMDDLSLETSSDFEMDDADYSLDDAGPDDTGIDDSEFDFDDSPATKDVEDSDDSGDMEIELEEDFSFEEDTGELPVEEEKEDFSFEMEETSAGEDTGLDFDDIPADEEATIDFDDAEPEEFEGIEFESIEDDSADFEEPGDPDSDTGLELSFESDDIDDATGLETEVVPLEDDFASEDDFQLEFDVSDEEDQEDAPLEDTGESSSLNEDLVEDDTDLELSLDDDVAADVEPLMESEEDFDEYDQVLAQETEPEIEEDISEPEPPAPGSTPIEKPEIEDPAPSGRRRRKRKPLIGTPILVIILLFLLVAGAYIASLMTGYKIPYLSDVEIPFLEEIFKKKADSVSDAKPLPNSKSVNGRFVTNATTGTLFVITGTVDNPSQTSFSHVEVKGALIIDNKVEAKTKTAYCGNIIAEDVLKTGNIADINKLLGVREGKNNINVNIKPGTSIPFMIVFSDLPEKLQNFTVKVARFDKGQ